MERLLEDIAPIETYLGNRGSGAMTRTWRPALLLAAVLQFVSGIGHAADTPPSVPAPTKPAAAATVADTITQILASEKLQRSVFARLEETTAPRDLPQRIGVLEAEVDALVANAKATAESMQPIDLDRRLRALRRAASTIVDDLGAIVRRLEHDGNALESDARRTRDGLAFLEKQLVPAPILERARSIDAKAERAIASIRERRDALLPLFDRAVALQARMDDLRALITAQWDSVRAQRLQLQELPLWHLGSAHAQVPLIAAELRSTWSVLHDYLTLESPGLAGVFLGILALCLWLFTRRSEQPEGSAPRAYGHPIAASLLIALMSLWWLAPDPPILFYEALLLLVPLPAAMVALRALPAPIPLTLYGLGVGTMLLVLRRMVDASAIADRVLLLMQVASIVVPVAVDLHRGRLQPALRRVSPGIVRAAALVVFAAAAVTVFNVIFGFAGPTRSLRVGMGSLLGFGLVFGATGVALYGAALALLTSPIVRWLRSARNADPSLLRAVRLVLTVLTISGVALLTLGSLGLTTTLRAGFESLLGVTLEVGSVSVAGSAVATALAVALATFLLAGVTGFILDREIVPMLQLRPGAGYAVVTFTRWVIVIVGAVLTLAALGVDPAKVTLVAGALSVGIGFGLQNVVNNFVSGLILIVERPVGVGDLIEVGPLTGEVKRIGIRSSTVRTGQGAEVIVPNSELVSKEVVNWTRSDRQRRYDIDVGVAYGSEPEHVMRLLVEAAGEVPEIMKFPAPSAMFRGFGDSSLDFRLMAWVQTIDVGLQAQNGLRIAILRKLDQAGIAIPFPQRDVHVHSAGDGAPQTER